MGNKSSKLSPALIAAQAARKSESARRLKLSDDQRFSETASAKITQVLRALTSLSNLPARPGFKYTKEQSVKMFSAIRTAVDNCEIRYIFTPDGVKKQKTGFTF